MRKKLVSYTHSNNARACIHECPKCGTQCSTLSLLEPGMDKRFARLQPPSPQPSVWYEYRFDPRYQRRNQWRLKCRGRVWSRCEYCHSIFLHINGKNGDHCNEKCPHWHEDQALIDAALLDDTFLDELVNDLL